MQTSQDVRRIRTENAATSSNNSNASNNGSDKNHPLKKKVKGIIHNRFVAVLSVTIALVLASAGLTLPAWGAGGANAGLGQGTNNRNPQVIFPDDNFPAPKNVDTIVDVEWTKRIDHQGYDGAYTQAMSQQYNGTATPSHVVLKKADNSVNFFGYGQNPNCDYVYSDKYNNLNALNFTMKPIALNFHTFVQSGFLFNGKMTGNTFDGYAVILSVDGVLALHKGSWDMSQGNYTSPTSTRIATYATGITNGSTASYTVRVVIDPATRHFDVYINGAQRSSIKQAVANDHNGFGFYTSYTSHYCSRLTVMKFSNTRIDMIKAPAGDPWSVLQKVNATVHYRLQTSTSTVVKPDTVQPGYIGQDYTITTPATITGSDGRQYTLISTSRGQRIDPGTKFKFDPNASNNETTLYYVLAGPKGTISGMLWIDNNGNGNMDTGERQPGTETFVLFKSDDVNFAHPLTRRQLFGENDDSVYYAALDANHSYTMTNIPAGKYHIRGGCVWGPEDSRDRGTSLKYGDGYDNKAVTATAADGNAHPYTANGKNWQGRASNPTILNVIISTNGQQVTNQNIGLTTKVLVGLVANPASGSTINGSGQTITYGIRIWPRLQYYQGTAYSDLSSGIKVTQVLPKGMTYAGGQSTQVKQTGPSNAANVTNPDSWPDSWATAPAATVNSSVSGPTQTTLADGRVQLVWTIDRVCRGHALLLQFNAATHGPGYFETNFVLTASTEPTAITSNTVAHATGQSTITERYANIDGQTLKADTSVMVNNSAAYTAGTGKTASITPPPTPVPPGGFTYDYAGFLLGDAEFNSYVNGINMAGTSSPAALRTGTPTFGPVNGNATVYLIFDKHRQKVTERYRVMGDAGTALSPDTITQQTQHDPYYLPISKLTPITKGTAVYNYVGYSVNGNAPINSSNVLNAPDFMYSRDALVQAVSNDNNYIVLWYQKNPALTVSFEQCDASGARINPGTLLKPSVVNSISAGDHAFFSDEWTKQFVIGAAPGTKYSYYGYSTDGGTTIIQGKPNQDLGVLSADLNITLFFANVRQVTVHFVEKGNANFMVSSDRYFLASSGSWDPQAADSGKLFDDLTVIDDPTDPNDRGRLYTYQSYNWTDDPYGGDASATAGKPGLYTGTGDGALTLYFSTYYKVNMLYHEYLSDADLANEVVPATLMSADSAAFKGGSSYNYPAPPQTLNALGRDGVMYSWAYRGFKLDSDKAMLRTGNPGFTNLWGQRDIICVYQRGAATAAKTITERFREQGNEANTLQPNNQLTVTGNPASYSRAAGTPPNRLTDPQTGTVFALVGYQWDDDAAPTISDFSNPAEANRSGITSSRTITYLYSAKRLLFSATCDGTVADSVNDNDSSTKVTIVFDNVLHGTLAFADLQVGGAATKSGTDFLNAAEIAGGTAGGWDGKTFVAAITPNGNALEGNSVSLTATITDPAGFYDPAFLSPSGTAALHARHKVLSATPGNPLVGTAWIDVVFDSSSGALPLFGMGLNDIRILAGSDGGRAYASRLVPHAAGNSGPPVLGEVPDGYHFSIMLAEVAQSGHIELWFNGNSDRFKVIGDPLSVAVVRPAGGGGGMTRYQFVDDTNTAYASGSTGAQALPDFSKQTVGVQKYMMRVGSSAGSDDALSSKYLDYGNGTAAPTIPELTSWAGNMVERSFEVLAGSAATGAGIGPGNYDLYTDGALNVIDVSGSYYSIAYRSSDFAVVGYRPYTGNASQLVRQKHQPASALRSDVGLFIDGVLVDYFDSSGSNYLSYYNVYDGSGLSGPDWFVGMGMASLPDTTFFYLQPHYVMPQDMLSNGPHTVYIRFTDGYALGQFNKNVSAPPEMFGDTIEVVRGKMLTGHPLRVNGLPFPDVSDASGAAFPQVTAVEGPSAGSVIDGITISGSAASESFSLDIGAAATAVAGDLPRFRLAATNTIGGTPQTSAPAEYRIRVIDVPGAPLHLVGNNTEVERGLSNQVTMTWQEPAFLGNTPLLGYEAKACYFNDSSGTWTDWQPLGAYFDKQLWLSLPDDTAAYAVQVWAYNKVGAGPQAVFVKALKGGGGGTGGGSGGSGGGSGGGGTGTLPPPPPGGNIPGSVTNNTDEYVDVDIFLQIGDERLSSHNLNNRFMHTNDFIALRGLAPGAISTFMFEQVPDGYYNVVSHVMPQDPTPPPDPPDKSYYITRGVAVTDGEASSSVILNLGRKQSVIEVAPGAPELSVDGLDGLFTSLHYTSDDQAVIEAGGVVEFKLHVAGAMAEDVAAIAAQARENGERSLTYFDLKIVKTRFAQDGTVIYQEPVPELDLSECLTLAVPMRNAISGKTAAHVYRTHFGVADVERLEPNTGFSYQNSATWNDELFNQDEYRDWLLLRTGKFSAYGASVLAYQLIVDVEGQGSVAGTPDDTLLIESEEVGLTAQPAPGWRFVEWRVSNARPSLDGGALALLMPANAVGIVAVFEQIPPDPPPPPPASGGGGDGGSGGGSGDGGGANDTGSGDGDGGGAGDGKDKDGAAGNGTDNDGAGGTGTGGGGSGGGTGGGLHANSLLTADWALLNLLFTLGCLISAAVCLFVFRSREPDEQEYADAEWEPVGLGAGVPDFRAAPATGVAPVAAAMPATPVAAAMPATGVAPVAAAMPATGVAGAAPAMGTTGTAAMPAMGVAGAQPGAQGGSATFAAVFPVRPDDRDDLWYKGRAFAVAGIVIGFLGITIFFLLERIAGEMVLINLRTPIFLLLFAASLISMLCSLHYAQSAKRTDPPPND